MGKNADNLVKFLSGMAEAESQETVKFLEVWADHIADAAVSVYIAKMEEATQSLKSTYVAGDTSSAGRFTHLLGQLHGSALESLGRKFEKLHSGDS